MIAILGWWSYGCPNSTATYDYTDTEYLDDTTSTADFYCPPTQVWITEKKEDPLPAKRHWVRIPRPAGRPARSRETRPVPWPRFWNRAWPRAPPWRHTTNEEKACQF